MAKNNNGFGSYSEIKAYQYELVRATGYGESEDGSSESKPRVSFTEYLGTTDWCKYMKCMPMSSGRKCQCC